ncbi:MAG: MCE family protein [Thermoleophilaceae bacterium]|nr:MCE family protein [Thermoleophilaceae bacterium]
MRRLVWIALAVAIVPWLVIGAVDATGDQDRDDAYFVRAVFDNASNLVAGEDLKIAGAVVGQVDSLEVTDDEKAAVVLRVDDEDFVPWKSDASCTIRPQSLIGEKFVECKPGTTAAAPLREIEDGPGEGERLLPISNTSSPVDLDLINNVMRLPYRQRFAILLSEFGAGLAGRGDELNEVIHRANPALRETDKVLDILAGQNRTLARLARDSDRALAPLSRERERVADWIVQANTTGEASAERSQDIRRGIELLPDFLRELEPLMADLDKVAVQGTPLLRDLGAAAPQMGRLIKGLGTFSEAANESFPSLGDALEQGRPDLIRSRPLIRKLNALGKEAKPAVADLDKLTASLQDTQGIERINDFLYYLTLATNGYDSLGHYLRAGLVATATCSNRAVRPASTGTCWALFFDPNDDPSAATASTASAKLQKKGPDAPRTNSLIESLVGSPEATKEQQRQAQQEMEQLRQRAKEPSAALQTDEPVLDYLLGADG